LYNLFIDVTKKDTVAESIITEQANLISDYHQYLKNSLDASRQMEKELGYYKKGTEHASFKGIKSRSSSKRDDPLRNNTCSEQYGLNNSSNVANQQKGKKGPAKV
jgi:uncharacterized protein YccT (UPF0319 family)